MPAPTDLLDADIKELRGDLAEMRGDIKALVASVGRIETKLAEGFGEVRADIREIRRDIAYITAIGRWILGVAMLMTAGVGGAIWYASKLDSRVGQVEAAQARAAK